ncbi:uncharacterized protein LOC121404975 [Drosophila obscura]|uniref:uncharacterized protein LOC121404975 n=1 Tax=Drosophila obscura TaxID=7282 RepID=UPI001BB26702|nr:uncharacterized protein LOC121404975 [Drosophila obscura]
MNSSKLRNAAQFDVNPETKQEGVAVITEWVVKNCCSFKIIDNSELKKFASFLIKVGATYGANVDFAKLLPHPTTISRYISMRESSCTGFHIREQIREILKDFGCDLELDNPIIVTDRGSNMIKAFGQDGKNALHQPPA